MNQLIISIPENSNSEAFVFSCASGTAYDSINRDSRGGWLNLDIINGKPLSQNTSIPLDSLSISGKWFGENGMKSIAGLRDIKNQHTPIMLSDSYGYNLGRWKIMQVSEKQKRVIDDGTALVIDFSIQLEEFANA